jgi:hypothetical protein
MGSEVGSWKPRNRGYSEGRVTQSVPAYPRPLAHWQQLQGFRRAVRQARPAGCRREIGRLRLGTPLNRARREETKSLPS